MYPHTPYHSLLQKFDALEGGRVAVHLLVLRIIGKQFLLSITPESLSSHRVCAPDFIGRPSHNILWTPGRAHLQQVWAERRQESRISNSFKWLGPGLPFALIRRRLDSCDSIQGFELQSTSPISTSLPPWRGRELVTNIPDIQVPPSPTRTPSTCLPLFLALPLGMNRQTAQILPVILGCPSPS